MARGGDVGRRVSVYTRLAGCGAALIVLAVLVFVVTDPGSAGILLVMGGLFGAAVLLARRFGGWATLPLLVLALPSLGFALSDIGIRIRLISFAGEFVPAVVVPVGVLFVALGVAGSIAQRIRGRVRERARPWERWLVRVVLGAAVGVSAASLVATFSTGDVPAGERVGAKPFLMEETLFFPDQLDARRGGSLRLYVRNRDAATHTFTVDELDVDLIVGPNGEAVVNVPAPRAGSFEYYCRVSGHWEQTGTLTVS